MTRQTNPLLQFKVVAEQKKIIAAAIIQGYIAVGPTVYTMDQGTVAIY